MPIPSGAVGHVGMVAMLRRVKPAALGKMVMVRRPAGLVTSLVGSSRPVFAWLALSLGEPLDINGKPAREIYVADACLVPLSAVPATEIEALVKAAARQDFDAALQDLSKILRNTTMSPEDFEGFLNKAADQLGIERALACVPTRLALQEIGFRSTQADEDSLLWTGLHDGVELRIDAGALWLGNWHVMACAVSHRQWVCDETRLAGEGQRGSTVARILSIWRNAFGNSAPVPDCLQVGLIFEAHQRLMQSITARLPSVAVQADVFRATLRWLRQIHEGEAEPSSVRLSSSDGFVRMQTSRALYACPGSADWPEACLLPLHELWAIPHQALRGTVNIRLTVEGVRLNGYPVNGAWDAEADGSERC